MTDVCAYLSRIDAAIVIVTCGIIHVATLTTVVYLVKRRNHNE